MIAAMAEECRPLLRNVQGVEARRLGNFAGYRFKLGNRDCLLVQSGMGIKHAAEAAHTLLAQVNPQVLVSFGIAGAVKENLQIGDVVAVRSVLLLEGGNPGPPARLAAFSLEAQEAITRALQPSHARLVWGSALTTRGSQVIKSDLPEMENPVLEMETAAIAQAAAQHGIPLLALRAISDNPAAPVPINPEAVMDENYRLQVGKMIRILILHPKILLRSGRILRNSALAAENAALAVRAALSTGSTTLTVS